MKEQIIRILNENVVDLYCHGLRYGHETNTPLIEEIAEKIAAIIEERMPKEEEYNQKAIELYPFEKVKQYSFRLGCKWFRSRMKGGDEDEHPTNKEKFDGNYIPDTDEGR